MDLSSNFSGAIPEDLGNLTIVGAMTTFVYIMIRTKAKKKEERMVSHDMVDILNHKFVSYHEILRATDNFSDDDLLGSRSFGKVFKGQLDNGDVVAIKVLNMQLEQAVRSSDAECHVLQVHESKVYYGLP
ncbi:hypothetical protein E2562_018621 [Oryza meyeriana var. granulata]|uniref:Uncharacterized protein n=1 Tax=Oryza meyeriana var. granulata TaxID=110450 RepID=A0A6G1BYP6_9ORYZ|nr:hypothetical protein E2562_018621 [Oryza meyeriana var. granulata]